MRKLTILFALLTLGVGLWAETQTVSYLYPVYNTDGNPASGIKEWKTTTADATVVESSTANVTWGTVGQTTWYVVTGADVQLSKGAVCSGDIRLILADGAKLTAKGKNLDSGVCISGKGGSLTIYGQTAQTGQLVANGGDYGAGIGGEYLVAGSNITINGGVITANSISDAGIGGGVNCSGSNIIINGGVVTANGGDGGAGIGGGGRGSGSNIIINGGEVTASGGNTGAGIGGGSKATGSNITINGGIVMAKGGREIEAGIGCGQGSATPASNIKVASDLILLVDKNNPPTAIPLAHTADTDIANDLKKMPYVIIFPCSSLTTIAVKTAPTKIEYLAGEKFKPAGLVITATCSNNKTANIIYSDQDKNFSFNPALDAALQNSTTQITISYGEQSCTQAIVMVNKADVIADIIAAMDGEEDSDYLNELVATYIKAIQDATTMDRIIYNKQEAIAVIQKFLPAYKAGKTKGDAAGYQRAQDELPTEGTSGPAVVISQGDKSVTLYNPDEVRYTIVTE